MRSAFTGDQRGREAWLAKVTESGATVTARNESDNAEIDPAVSDVRFDATTGRRREPVPAWSRNGVACSLT